MPLPDILMVKVFVYMYIYIYLHIYTFFHRSKVILRVLSCTCLDSAPKASEDVRDEQEVVAEQKARLVHQ